MLKRSLLLLLLANGMSLVAMDQPVIKIPRDPYEYKLKAKEFELEQQKRALQNEYLARLQRMPLAWPWFFNKNAQDKILQAIGVDFAEKYNVLTESEKNAIYEARKHALSKFIEGQKAKSPLFDFAQWDKFGKELDAKHTVLEQAVKEVLKQKAEQRARL